MFKKLIFYLKYNDLLYSTLQNQFSNILIYKIYQLNITYLLHKESNHLGEHHV